jgi:hypothetical protein
MMGELEDPEGIQVDRDGVGRIYDVDVEKSTHVARACPPLAGG